jgi:CCR4-NOT complex subunit CAF16
MNEKRIDSPLMALCLSLLRKDKEREKAKKAQGKLLAIDPNTGLPHTKWDDLSEDMKTYGDKYVSFGCNNANFIAIPIHFNAKIWCLAFE